jgi:hypothetical protein
MKKTKTFYNLGDELITFESDTFNGEYFDTKVLIGENYICTIEGNKIAEFAEKLQGIIMEYRI